MTDVPTYFTTEPSGVSAIYDYTDVASGLGIINYKAFTTEVSGASAAVTGYALGTNTVYSTTIATWNTTASTTTMNFDSPPFNLPKTAKGTAYFSCGLACTNGGYVQVTTQLQKWNGTTATNLSAEISGSYYSAGGTATVCKMALLPIPLTQTIIKKGEQLRCVVKFINITGDDAEIGHDPQGRSGIIVSGASVTTAMNLYMPFRIEVQ